MELMDSMDCELFNMHFVIINENCEIGCGSTIDRGSLSNTIIGKNTYLDNQVHIAHNNKIGDNCMLCTPWGQGS